MEKTLHFSATNKAARYEELAPQLESVLSGESDPVANMANTAAVLREAFGWYWVGFYIVRGGELVLGPFQGTLACTRIAHGRGVCGTAWAEQRTLIVPDVEQFAGHIACSALSRSEIVVPLFSGDEVVAVLDIDSTTLSEFDAVDALWLEKIAHLVVKSY